MTQEPGERIPRESRLRSTAEFARLKSRGRALRGVHCLVVVEPCPGEVAKIAFVASRKGVGGAVQRNRARRRLREIVRRLWPEVAPTGVHMMFVAFRTALTSSHAELRADVERLLRQAARSEPS
jgi:ribonuclease P protein component